ncbi:MAG: hypothetical protein AABY10_02090 [Nanoarchaeota archaeon]
MLDKVLSFLRGVKLDRTNTWNPEHPNLIKATREALRKNTRYSQYSVDKAEFAYHQSIEDRRSDSRVSSLREEYEHRRKRCAGSVVWVDGFRYPIS